MAAILPLQLSPAAIVSKAPVKRGDADLYLRFATNGAPTWVDEPSAATAFATMREATRASARLPGALRAFALPRDVECLARDGVGPPPPASSLS